MSNPKSRQQDVGGHQRGGRQRTQQIGGYSRTVTIDPEKWRNKSRLAPETQQRIVQMREAGDSLPTIAQTLTREQVPSSTGKTAWSPSMVRQALGQAGKLTAEGAGDSARRLRPLAGNVMARLVELLEDGLTYPEIAEAMNREGFLTPTRRAWTRSSVGHHLASRPRPASAEE